MPLIFFDKNYAISEAEIANVEVPKVALLRSLAGVIAVLWSLEWAIKSRAFQGTFPWISSDTLAAKTRPSKLLRAFGGWLNVHPTRWLLLAAALFFGSTFVSTVFSASFINSMWGEIPGQDGYSAYTIASYGILFGVIATHLKSKAQMGRLLGAVVFMGVLVGLYANLQHFGHDFFSITESTGGGSTRVTVFMGNAIFAGAVLAMTIPVTLVAAAINLQNEDWGDWGPLSRLGQLSRDSVATFLWAMVLAVQLLGLMFTFSRGPWSGAVLALVVFLGLVALSLGWRMLIRTGLVVGLAAVLSIALLHWQGSVSVGNVGPWLGILFALMGLAGTVAVLFIIKRYGWAIVSIAVLGSVVTIVGASILAPSALSGRGTADSTDAGEGAYSTTGQVVGRIKSIQTDVLGGFVGGRGTHWKVSWTLIKDRPWFEFDDLSLSWLRPVIGYGPDLFRYTYLLESPPDARGFTPLEPDHAHNFFIHQTVEQGYFGGLASLALFATVFGIAGHHILRRRATGDPVYRLLMFGLVAVFIGRFLEMMVGVARISDLTVLWVVFGLLAASASFDNQSQDAAALDSNGPARNPSRRSRRRAARASAASSFSTGLIFRLAVVAWLAGGLGVVTWQKSINYVRASVAEGRALAHFREGDLESSIVDLDKAIRLAPGVPSYYNNRAQVFLNYQLRPEDFREPVCSGQSEVPYLVCLGLQSLESNLESVNQQPFNYRARIAAANSAFNLNLHESAIESYAKASSMVPSAWSIRNDLAESRINAGLYEDALAALNASLGITGDSDQSTLALFFKGRALQELGRPDEAIIAFKRGLSLKDTSGTAPASLSLIREINAAEGVQFNLEYFDRNISQNPDDAVAYYFRGWAHLALGDAGSANLDIEKSSRLGLELSEVRTALLYTRFKSVDKKTAEFEREMRSALKLDPSALLNVLLGEFFASQGQRHRALDYLEDANSLDPDLGLAYLVRGKIFVSLGMEESAKEVLDSSNGLALPAAQDYVDRGEIYAFLGDYDLAFSDLDEAIRINPAEAKHYNARAKTYANLSRFESAISDLDNAIRLDPGEGEYLINRGVIYDILGEAKRSLADFESAESLGESSPPPKGRDTSYFAVFTDTTSRETEARLRINLQVEREAAKNVQIYSAIEFANDKDGLQILAKAYVDLENWERATTSLSALIELSPDNTEAYIIRGDAYLALNNTGDAINDYLQAVRLDPSSADNLVARAKGYGELGEYDLARNDIDEAIRLDPGASDAYALRGYLSVQTGNGALALPDIDRAIEIAPLNHDAYFKRAKAYAALGRTSLALDDLEQALRIEPTNFDYLYNRGLLRWEIGDLSLAIEDFDGVIALKAGLGYLDPRHATPFVSRGRIYLQIGNPLRSMDDANKAIGLLRGKFAHYGWADYKPERDRQLSDAIDLLADANTELGRLEEADDASDWAARFR